jgi:hypothetical protein
MPFTFGLRPHANLVSSTLPRSVDDPPTDTYHPSKYIITNDTHNDNMGYIVEEYDAYGSVATSRILPSEGGSKATALGRSNSGIYVTYWAFINNDEEILEKRVFYNSMSDLYEESKLFVNSLLTNRSLLHQSKYKMMRDFIKYYETNQMRSEASFFPHQIGYRRTCGPPAFSQLTKTI